MLKEDLHTEKETAAGGHSDLQQGAKSNSNDDYTREQRVGWERPSEANSRVVDFKTAGNIVLHMPSEERRRRGTQSLHNICKANVRGSVVKGGSGLVDRVQALSAPKQQDAAYRSSGGRRESPPPLQDPEAGPGHPHCCETHEQAPSAASAVLGVCEPQLPIRGLQGGAKGYACCPEGTPDEGNNSQHTLREEALNSQHPARGERVPSPKPLRQGMLWRLNTTKVTRGPSVGLVKEGLLVVIKWGLETSGWNAVRSEGGSEEGRVLPKAPLPSRVFPEEAGSGRISRDRSACGRPWNGNTWAPCVLQAPPPGRLTPPSN
ncbi:unnamed protein product [Rangifer tarandus platyrhynchus]|uniref:Uncharacterized protein n=1 Tax=Rangifer tarandus platyrhynchus TaxID=3082113 RepID=A0ABN8YTZ9_RANTA|nr:unnamed protein product [Rangifer tarandus platyrhynchus]